MHEDKQVWAHTHTPGNTLTCFPLVGGFNLDTVPTFFKDQAPPALFHSCLVSLFKETDVVYSSVELLSRRESLCFCTEMRQSQSLNKPSGIFLATATVYGQHNYITIAWLIVRQVKKRVVFGDHSNQIESARKTTVANTKPLRLQKNCFYTFFFWHVFKYIATCLLPTKICIWSCASQMRRDNLTRGKKLPLLL